MIRAVLLSSLLAVAGWQLGQAGLVQGKAWLGQWLLERAWQRSLQSAEPTRPWPGAVSHPVARLRVPELGVARLVLDGIDTPVLAWGPGLSVGSAGHWLMAAHRDTHFRFLAEVEPGMIVEIEGLDGHASRWQILERTVVDSRFEVLDADLPGPRLTLVTCYPFDAARAGGPLRLVFTLLPEGAASAAGYGAGYRT